MSDTPNVCPACGKPIVNRRVDYCLYCMQELPDELLADDSERAAHAAEKERLRAEAKRVQQEAREREKERAKQRARRGKPGFSGF